MPYEEVVNVGWIDPTGRAELVAGKLAATNPIPDRPIRHREVVGQGALGEEGWTGSFRLHTPSVQCKPRMHPVTSETLGAGVEKTEGQGSPAPS
jgi:hypothetical protein